MPERRCSLQYTQTVPVVLHYTVFVPWANTFAYGQRNLFVLRKYTGESVLSRRHTAQHGSGAWSEESVMLAFRHPHVFSPCTCFYSVALLQVFYESSFFFYSHLYCLIHNSYYMYTSMLTTSGGDLPHQEPPVRFRCLRLIPVMCSCCTCAFSATSLSQ